ncbi:hypothetical protein GE09DRAFT_182503 [Coniochaeta sp. 2T2.1]|nr:hypothetical protein GE09DRAFT_182503 [Coniochaeta sp. 2T2.1]
MPASRIPHPTSHIAGRVVDRPCDNHLPAPVADDGSPHRYVIKVSECCTTEQHAQTILQTFTIGSSFKPHPLPVLPQYCSLRPGCDSESGYGLGRWSRCRSPECRLPPKIFPLVCLDERGMHHTRDSDMHQGGVWLLFSGARLASNPCACLTDTLIPHPGLLDSFRISRRWSLSPRLHPLLCSSVPQRKHISCTASTWNVHLSQEVKLKHC